MEAILEVGTNIWLYTSNNTAAQRYEIKLYGKRVLPDHGRKNRKSAGGGRKSSKNGANLQQYEWNGNDGQLWKFVRTGTNSYYLKSKLGTVIKAASEKCEAGSNVELGTLNESSMRRNGHCKNRKSYSLEEGTYVVKKRIGYK